MGGRKDSGPTVLVEQAPPDDDGPSAPRPRGSRPKSGRKRKRGGGRRGGRSILSRLAYWGMVLAIWVVIAAVGSFAYVASTLPPIQSLEVPKRPPTIEIVGLDGRVLVTRGEMSGTDVPIQ